jgi:hypothetical protein
MVEANREFLLWAIEFLHSSKYLVRGGRLEDRKRVSGTSVTPVKNLSRLAPKQNANPANPVARQVLDEKSTLGNIADAVKPAPPPSNADGDFAHTGPVWWIGLNNDQTHDLEGVLATGGSLLA